MLENFLNPTYLVLAVFVIGYVFIIFEHIFHVNKSATAIITAVIAWAIIFITDTGVPLQKYHFFNDLLAETAQIMLFLMGALMVVETINVHKGFNFITSALHFNQKRTLLWVIGVITFFLSSILDNLTTTIVMVTLIQKMVSEKYDRWFLGSAIVIAANAGGAWTPIGDVTTTMLWIGGQLSTLHIIKTLFIPSVVCLILSYAIISLHVKGKVVAPSGKTASKIEPHGKVILFLGVSLLIFIPIFKILTGLPPFVGMLFALAVLWIYTDIVHRNRSDLRLVNVIKGIDLPSVLFFLGILLAVGALEKVGILTEMASYLESTFKSPVMIATIIGFLSAVVDNVPLVAAAMGMYKLSFYPPDSHFWSAIAFAAGTGGSMLIIGSAAGVVFMGLEKVDFFWYLKKISFAAMVGFLGGILTYVLLEMQPFA